MSIKIHKSVVFGLFLAVALFASACGTLVIEQEPASGGAQAPATATAMPLPTATEMPPPTSTPTSLAQDKEIVWDSEITSLDETWNQYTSNGQGFTIKFPKTMVTFRGSCTWNQEQGSYRPQMAVVPVKIFEDADAVYIAPEYYYELAGERIETFAHGGTRAFYNECNQVTNSLELLCDPDGFKEPFWKLVVAEIDDDAGLEGFLKARYGSGCSLGEQVPTAQEGVYDVKILGDGKSMEETQCLLNFGTVVKYYPEGNKVVAWDTGQAVTFPADVNYAVSHDQEMVDSFEFITDAATQASGGFVPAGASEEISDWWGIIGSTEPGAQFDDYFERQDLGQIIYFGIESRDPAVQAQIEALRDSGKVVHLYGTVLSNVPDYNGSQILVTRIEVEGEGAEADAPEGWETFVDDEFGFTFQYPADWALEVIPRRAMDEGAGSPQWLADAIVLREDKLTISIQFMHTSETGVAWDGRFGGGGLVQEADVYQVNLLDQEAQKWVWTDDDGVKALMVQTVNQEADLVLTIQLYDASVQWIGDPAAETLSDTAMGVLDGVLNSLALTQ